MHAGHTLVSDLLSSFVEQSVTDSCVWLEVAARCEVSEAAMHNGWMPTSLCHVTLVNRPQTTNVSACKLQLQWCRDLIKDKDCHVPVSLCTMIARYYQINHKAFPVTIWLQEKSVRHHLGNQTDEHSYALNSLFGITFRFFILVTFSSNSKAILRWWASRTLN